MVTARSNGINPPYLRGKYHLVLKVRLHSKKIHSPIDISNFVVLNTLPHVYQIRF